MVPSKVLKRTNASACGVVPLPTRTLIWFVSGLHLVAVIAFLGNITTGLFWHAHAARSRNPMLLAFTMEGIIRSDRLFTIPGVLGIIVSGVATAMQRHLPILGTTWILVTLVLFSVSGLVFVARVAPLQRQLLALAQGSAQSASFEYPRYHALARRWEVWGAVALATPIVGLIFMVLRPAL
jgi:uncharacterized membrane protein